MDEKLLNTQEVANQLGVRVSTIRAWVFQKRIPCIRLGRLVRFRPSEIERWVKKGSQQVSA